MLPFRKPEFLNSFGGDPNIVPQEEAQKNFIADIQRRADYIRIAKIQPQ